MEEKVEALESSDQANASNDGIKLEKESTTEPDQHGLYSYTKLKDFTSEIFKIELGNLPNFIGYGQLRKLLYNLQLNPRKVKAIGNPPHFAYITFKDEEDRDKALKVLNGHMWKKKFLTAKKANPAADPMARKRKSGDSEDCSDPKKAKSEDLPVELRLKNAVTPLWNVPYEEQLQIKKNDVHKFLMKLAKQIGKVNKDLKELLSIKKKQNHQQCCPFSRIESSPVITGYRNKCEFTIGRHLHTKEKTVGFRLSTYKEGSMSVAEPDDCINISEAMLKAVKSVQDYIRHSDKDVYNPENHAGHWRQLTVRTSNNSDVLIIVIMHPQSLSEVELQEERAKLKKYFKRGPGSSCGITSVYFQFFSKRESAKNTENLSHLMGRKGLEETLLGMKFNISPEAFFQINVPASEVMFSIVADMVKSSPTANASPPVVLDICCGTGTISLCIAKVCEKVFGIDICLEAIKNAQLNAKKNGVSNVEFICGKAEDAIFSAFKKCGRYDNIIAIVDPPRAGLHQKVLKAIHACTKIEKLIYISCNPNSACQNFIDLCRPASNNYKGSAFFPTQAAAVDMFPYTPHKELVLVFERAYNVMKSVKIEETGDDSMNQESLIPEETGVGSMNNGVVVKKEETGDESMNQESLIPEETGDGSMNNGVVVKKEDTGDESMNQESLIPEETGDGSMNKESPKHEGTDGDSINRESIKIESSDNPMNESDKKDELQT